MLLNEFDGCQRLAGAVGLLCQVDVEDGRAARPDVTLRQRVDHQQHVDGPLPLPVAGDRVKQVLAATARVQRRPARRAAAAGRRYPGRQTLPHVVEMTPKPDVERPRQDVDERLAAGQTLAGGERGERRRVEQVEFEVQGVGRLERALGVGGHVVPDARVRHVDRAEEVGRRSRASSTQRPQKRVEPTLILDSSTQPTDTCRRSCSERLSLPVDITRFISSELNQTKRGIGPCPVQFS